MTAIEFYKYIDDNGIEWKWAYNSDTQEKDVLIFPFYFQIEDLRMLMHPSDFDDERIHCVMKYGYFAIWTSDILARYGIELNEVFAEANVKTE